MTDKTKASLRKGALWLAPFLFAVGGWGGQRYDASLVHQTEYHANRITDSLNARYDRREILDSLSQNAQAIREIRDCLRAKGCR